LYYLSIAYYLFYWPANKAFHKFRYYIVISTEAPVPPQGFLRIAFAPVPALPPFLLSQESPEVQARKHGGGVEKSIFQKYFLFQIVV